MSKFSHNEADDDARAMTIPQHFLRNQMSYKRSPDHPYKPTLSGALGIIRCEK